MNLICVRIKPMTEEDKIEFDAAFKLSEGRTPKGFKKVRSHWRRNKDGTKTRVEMHYRKIQTIHI
tara:strand:+ start:4368 stop:4562 length:195 start_codon:yes stop_codon:yes gene_type:complete